MSSARKNERRKALLNRFADNGFDAIQRWFLVKDAGRAERRGEALGKIWYRLDQKHRERCIANVGVAFPELSQAERIRLAQKVFLHFGRVAGDFLRTPLRTDREVIETMEVEGREYIEVAESRGKGIIAVTAHFGNWERFAQWCTASLMPISVVARDANQGGVQEKLTKLRETAGIRVVSRGNSARAMLSCLRHNEMIGLLPDQNSDECFVPFFGISTGTVMGPAVLHQRTGAVLIPAYCARIGVGKYRVILREPVDFENVEKDPKAITAELNAVLESVIRQYPDQYLWMHDRWKESRLLGLL